MCNSHCRDVPGIFGERVGFCRFWYKTGLAGPMRPKSVTIWLCPAASQGVSNVLTEGEILHEFWNWIGGFTELWGFFFSNVIKNIFWNLRNVIKDIFWILRGDLFLNKIYTERSPMSFKFVLGVGTWYFCTFHFVLC